MISFFSLLGQIDRHLFLILNTAFANPFLDIVFSNGTNATFWIVPGTIALILFFLRKKKEALAVTLLSLLLVAITDPVATRILKPLFGRHRPCHPELFVAGGHFLDGMRTSLSLPSVHASNMFAQATLFSWFYPRLRPVYFGFALFIGYSRIYIGVHYPFDVFAGFLFGFLTASALLAGYRFVSKKIIWLPVPSSVKKDIIAASDIDKKKI